MLTDIFTELEKNPEFRKILYSLQQGQSGQVVGLVGSGKAYFLSALHHKTGKKFLVITPSSEEAETWWEELNSFGVKAELFPEREVLSYQSISPPFDVTALRLTVLSKLLSGDIPVVVAPIEAVISRIIARSAFDQSLIHLYTGQKMGRDDFIQLLEERGYRSSDLVTHCGEYGYRGGIVDIYSVSSPLPVRVEFFGDRIESLREFDIATQRSVQKITEVLIPPGREILLFPQFIEEAPEKIGLTGASSEEIESLLERIDRERYFEGVEQYFPFFNPDGSLLDYFPVSITVILDEVSLCEKAAEKQESEIQEMYQEVSSRCKILAPPENFLYSFSELMEKITSFSVFYLSLLPSGNGLPIIQKIEMKSPPIFRGQTGMLVNSLEEWRSQGFRSILVGGSEGQLKRWEEWFSEYNCFPGVHLQLAVGKLASGFIYPAGNTVILTENEIFGRRKQRYRRPRFQEGISITNFAELQKGDYVVHVDYGIGIFQGIKTLNIDKREADYLHLEYAEGDRLYVPVDHLNQVQKYIGKEGYPPKIYRLGTSTWHKVKERVKRSVKEIARELLHLYAARQVLEGFCFPPDTSWQQEFEGKFIYEETPDQWQAIQEVKKDMESPKSMERLICGDVGYGKTEVAMRSAFKAVMAGKQAAVLVPTTILAQQHYRTFTERFIDYPVNIAVLSRFKSRKEQKEIIRGLKEGTIDIVIGTHRLLQKDIVFRELGLVVIDEEHRFGVTQKEKLKQLRKLVDVLILSATPIPRTLYMALSGIREMSIINTPPENRFPIQTYVMEYNEAVIREAILQELDRGGQVYFVHPRVRGIERIAQKISQLVPEARVAIGHGQMEEEKLEKVMIDFLDNRFDVFVSTNIIEAGLDITNVNTIFINRAHMFGLAELYQMRGRVGRGNRRAYAFLFYPREWILTRNAQSRLKTIEEYTELGSGFRIALRDLEIRGMGNILGREQHGHMLAVGFDLYCQLVEEAVRELKGEKIIPPTATVVDLGLNAYFPDDYIGDSRQKLALYKRLVAIEDLESLSHLREEMQDRYGPLPPPGRKLLEIAEIRIRARESGVSRIQVKDNQLQWEFTEGTALSIEKGQQLIRKYRHLRFLPGEKTGFILPRFREEDALLQLVKNILQDIRGGILVSGGEKVESAGHKIT